MTRTQSLRMELRARGLAAGPSSTPAELAQLAVLRAAAQLVEAALIGSLIEPDDMRPRTRVAVAIVVQETLLEDARAGSSEGIDALWRRLNTAPEETKR